MPQVTGKILLNGEPLAGVKVERELYYIDDKKRFDNTNTDEQGHFTLPAIDVRSKAPGWGFAEQQTKQVISISYQNQFYELWSGFLPGIKPLESYNKKLAQLNADLANPCVAFTFINDKDPNNPHCAYSICRWPDDFEIIAE